MKKVLFVATIDSHISAFHLPYLKLFHDNGYEVHVATNGSEEFSYCDKKIVIPFERSPYKFNNIKAIFKLRKVILKEKYNIIHTHTPMGSVVTRLAAIKARRKYGTRVIYTAHGFHFYKGAPIINWLLFYPVEKFLSRYTDTLITINKEDYNLAKKKFKKCKDIKYVPGVGIDTKKFDFRITDREKQSFKKSLGLDKNSIILTCVARLDKNKNQGFLIDVMKELINSNKHIHLLLVGPDELDGLYQKKVRDKNLDNNVHFLGRREDIPRILSITNIVVSASLREGLPVNVLEAMASSLPVVALNCRGMSDLIENGKNGFIVNSKDEFVNKVNSLVDKKIYSKLDDKFLLSNVINNIKDIYFRPVNLLFIHGGGTVREDNNSTLYIDGSYPERVWKRYYLYADNVIVLFRKDKKIYQRKELLNKYPLLYKKNKYVEIPNMASIKNFVSIKKHLLNKNVIKKSVITSDIVIARVPSMQSNIAIKYARKYNKKLLVEVVGCPFDAFWNHSFIGKIIAIPEMIMMKHYVKYASNVMYVTNNFLQKRYPTKGNSIGLSDVVLNDLSEEILENRLRRIKQIRGKKIVLGTVGAVGVKYKGQQYVIRALRELERLGFDNYEYQMIGSGNSRELINLAKELGVFDKIKFLGPKSHENVLEWYSGVDIYIQPSNTEGLCRSIIEAMSLACPCIVSNAGGNPELIDSNYVFKKKNIKELTELIIRMNKKEMINQAKNNFKNVNNYSLDKLNKIRDEFYSSVLNVGD